MSENALVILRESLDTLAEGYGFDTQLDEAEGFLLQHSLAASKVAKLVENSTTWDRKNFEALLQEAISRRSEVPWVVFPRVDRFARKAEAAAYYLGLLRRAGLKLGFAREKLVVTNETGAMEFLMVSFQTAKADEDARTIKANTMAGRLKRAQRDGKLPNGGHRWCFDYDKATGRAVINVEKANHVRNWSRWLIEEGVSLAECCRRMEELGVPAPKGGLKWRQGTITRILRDRALIGEFYAYKEKMVGDEGQVKKRRECQKEPFLVYEDRANTILDAATFDAIQRRLQRNIELSQRHVKLNYTSARGFVFCGTCGHRMAGVPCRGTPYFRCAGCRRPSVRADVVWRVFSGQIRDILIDPEYLYEALREYFCSGKSVAQVKHEIAQLEAQLAHLDDADTKILRLYLTTSYPEDRLKREHERIEKQKAILSGRIDQLEIELTNLKRVKLTKELLREYAKWFQSEVANFTDEAWHRLLARWDMKLIIDRDKRAILQMRSPIAGYETGVEVKASSLGYNDSHCR